MGQKRSIFEEVDGNAPRADRPQPGAIDRARRSAGWVRLWLLLLFLLIVAIIFVGGLTRLTDSGLSITEWKPLAGALPPLSADAWAAEFARYQTFPEYQLQNTGMTLAEFKSIFWWEWGHRLLGRLIGLVWAVGLLGLWRGKRIPTGWTPRLFGIGVLIGVQGAVGWWMVSSGLAEGKLDVASYRLATHLGLAFVILGLIAWYILTLGRGDADLLQARRGREVGLLRLSTILLGLVFVQILLGALVAGIDAGRSYTDWPLMAGRFFPEGALDITPLWRNFFEDAGLVQFIHRMSGYVVFLFGIHVWRASRKSGNRRTRRALDAVALMLIGQMALGIATVILAAPVGIAIIHQLGAVALWVLIIRVRFLSHYPQAQSIKGVAA